MLVRSSGDASLPACVVRYGETDPEDLAVRYFEEANGLHKAQEAAYEILPEDIIRRLPDPDIVFRGRRLFYSFSL